MKAGPGAGDTGPGRVDGAVIRVGLLGEHIAASQSPVLHEREAAAQGFRLSYILHDCANGRYGVADLPRLLAGLQQAGYAGVNITHPFKQAVVALLDRLDPVAEQIGAVNTVAFTPSGTVGFNTDQAGFAASLREDLHGARLDAVVLLGAGGAGSAAAWALLEAGAGHVGIYDMATGPAAALCTRLGAQFGSGRAAPVERLEVAVRAASGLVQATPVGMTGRAGTPIPPAWLRQDAWLAELIYFPAETALLAAARRLGCRAINGAGMVVHQAAAGFRIFTGRVADPRRMAATLRPGPGGRPGAGQAH